MKCRTFRRAFLLLSLIGGLLADTAPLLAAATHPADHSDSSPPVRVTMQRPVTEPQTDQLIVKFRDAALRRAGIFPEARLKSLNARAGLALSHLRPVSGEGQVFKLPARMSHAKARAVAARLAEDPGVEYAVIDRIMSPSVVPNDASYAGQWDLKTPDLEVSGSNLPRAWDLGTGSATIVVGVVDTGIVNHADLQGRILPGYNFISDPYMAGNGVGRSADGADLGDWTNDSIGTVTSPSSWHGSHVTGTIAAASNNGIGVTGINWNSKVVPVRVLGHGGGYWSDIADGMRWGAGLPVQGVPLNPNPARVLNLSLGGTGSCDAFTQGTIDDVVAAGTVVVVAAGNSSVDAATASPANCNNVITVAALARNGAKSWYSNYGSVVKIAAPGDLILSTLNTGSTTPVASPAGDTYGQYSGTSMATPHVTGVVSLLLSVNPSLTPAQVLGTLKATARPFPAGSDCTAAKCGAGILDAYAAVAAASSAAPILSAAPAALNISKIEGDAAATSMNLTIDLINGSSTSWSVTGSAPWIQLSPSSGQGNGSVTVSVDVSSLQPGEHDGSVAISAPGALNSTLTIPLRFDYKGVLKVNAPLPVAAAAPALAAVNGKVYVIGGVPSLNTVQIYDTASDTWSSGAAKPTGGSYFNAAVIDGKIYVPGGRNGTSYAKALEVYDPATDRWSSRAPLPVALAASAVETVNGKLYLIGGSDGSQGYPSVYQYDPLTNTWSGTSDLWYAGRSYLGSGVIDGKIYVFGGWDDWYDLSQQTQVYDPATDSWPDLGSMPVGRMSVASAVLGGKLYSFGGSIGTAVDRYRDAFVFDPASGSWSDASLLLNQPRADLKGVTVGDRIYVMGGNYALNSYQTASSNYNESYTLPAAALNGVCGSANGTALPGAPTSGLCSAGSAGDVVGTGPWSWSCLGQNGGLSAGCSALPTFLTVLGSNILPTAMRGQGFAVTLSATGGTPPYRWSAATALPSGLTLNASTGVLSGIPTAGEGSYSLQIGVSDTASAQAAKDFSFQVKLPRAMIVRSPAEYYDYPGDAYNYCVDGDTVKFTNNVAYTEALALVRNIKVSLLGGFEDTFTSSGGRSVVNGKLRIANGTVRLDGIAIH